MTDVSLKEYLERRITDLERSADQRFHAAAVAVGKAEQMMNDRLAGMNEFRDALRDQTRQYASRTDVARLEQALHQLQQQSVTRLELEKVEERVSELQRARANIDGRLMIIAAGLSVITSLLFWLVTQNLWGYP